MKNKKLICALLMIVAVVAAYAQPVNNDTITREWVKNHYDKREVQITMRDGVKLYTVIYEPKDRTVKHPILMERSCYSSAPYGEEYFWLERFSFSEFVRNGYIIVFQDVRGKNKSEGEFEDMRPFVEGKKRPKYNKKGEVVVAKQMPTDEASDAYDTAEWLIHNTGSNGNIGVFGVSYPGFYATMAALSGHPAIKAVSPQAPTTDWFRGDDAHHNGAMCLVDMFSFMYWFEYQNIGAYANARYGFEPMPEMPTDPSDIVRNDVYTDYLKMGAVKNFTALLGDSVKSWNNIMAHPDLDQWWEDRNVLYHLKNAKVPIMVVGGLFDAEDCYGAFATYKQLKKDATSAEVYLVEGPWAHGGWSRGAQPFFGHVYFGEEQTSSYYIKNIEYPFFAYYLEGKGEKPMATRVYDSGSLQWRCFDKGWCEVVAQEKRPYFLTENGLMANQVRSIQEPVRYVSDPARPVPYTMEPGLHRTTTYMIDDQRFAATRTDVAVFEGGVLTDTLQLLGDIEAELEVSISTTDADFVVKLIDVFPEDFSYPASVYGEKRRNAYPMSGYQMLVRGEVMRGKYRNSFSSPEPFVPNEKTTVRFKLADVAHTFLPGHKLMVQVQSTWFPLIDRNPQKFCNIYECDDSDFQKAEITIYPDSKIWLPIK